DLQPIAIDLYDPETWKKYGWSPINDAEFRRRYETKAADDESAHVRKRSLSDLDGYFAAVLNRARLFHAALDVALTGDTPVALLAIGGDCEETFNAPVLLKDPKRNRWMTLTRPREYRTSTGKKISKREATEAIFAPGD